MAYNIHLFGVLVCSNRPCVLYLCDVADGSTSGVVQVDSQTPMPYTVLDYALATQSMRNEEVPQRIPLLAHFIIPFHLSRD